MALFEVRMETLYFIQINIYFSLLSFLHYGVANKDEERSVLCPSGSFFS